MSEDHPPSESSPPSENWEGAKPFAAGVNHRTGSLSLRDILFVEDDALPPVLESLKAKGITDAVLLSTCDRVEVIGFHDDPAAAAEAVLADFAERAGETVQSVREQTFQSSDDRAVTHVFRVAAGLDSLVVGEPQVLGQVKACHRLARDAGACGKRTEGLFQAAYGAAKRILNETSIGEGPVSIAAAASRVARELHGDLAGTKALLLGSGEMGELICRSLLQYGLGSLTVAHTRLRRATRLAEALGAAPAVLDDLGTLLPDADILITAQGTGTRVITRDMVEAALKRRRRRPVLVVDAAVPADVDPTVHRLDDAFLYEMSDLERLAMTGITDREQERARALGLVDEEVDAYLAGRREREAVPVITQLRMRFEEEREDALKASNGDAEKATHLLINRLLHTPTVRLKDAAADGNLDVESAKRLLAELFLSPDPKKENGQ